MDEAIRRIVIRWYIVMVAVEIFL